ncbi:homocysteine S-methyltransferase family protein [Escherichia coli]
MRNATSPPTGTPGLPNAFGEYDLGRRHHGEARRKWAQAGFLNPGGCCGTTPQHIAAMSRAVEGFHAAQTAGNSILQLCVRLRALNIADTITCL